MRNLSLISAVVYTGISLLAAGIFALVTLSGDYTIVERLGGAGWVFFLSMIILMPVVIPSVKKKLGKET